jgi:hypothetical protein
MKTFVSLCALVFSLPSFASFESRALQAAEAYYLDLAQGSSVAKSETCPPPSPTACVDEVCNRLGAFGCRNTNETTEVVRACAGNYGAGCVKVVCGLLSNFDCNDLTELLQVARACRANVDGSCVQATCKRLGEFNCKELSEVLHVARACSGALF